MEEQPAVWHPAHRPAQVGDLPPPSAQPCVSLGLYSENPSSSSLGGNSSATLERACSQLGGHSRAISDLAFLRRFTLETEVDLREPLQALGMTAMFDARAADFSSLSGRSSGPFLKSQDTRLI